MVCSYEYKAMGTVKSINDKQTHCGMSKLFNQLQCRYHFVSLEIIG